MLWVLSNPSQAALVYQNWKAVPRVRTINRRTFIEISLTSALSISSLQSPWNLIKLQKNWIALSLSPLRRTKGKWNLNQTRQLTNPKSVTAVRTLKTRKWQKGLAWTIRPATLKGGPPAVAYWPRKARSPATEPSLSLSKSVLIFKQIDEVL